MRRKSREWGIVVVVVVDKREIRCCCYCCSCKENSFCFYTVNDVVVVGNQRNENCCCCCCCCWNNIFGYSMSIKIDLLLLQYRYFLVNIDFNWQQFKIVNWLLFLNSDFVHSYRCSKKCCSYCLYSRRRLMWSLWCRPKVITLTEW